MKIYNNLTELIGNTPLVQLSRFWRESGAKAQILAKLEHSNAFGSVKDRVALQMIKAAEKSGQLKPGGTIIEATSGNTGIALAAIAAARGYKMLIIMPSGLSAERQKLLSAYGAKIIFCDAAKGMRGAIAEAERLSKQIENSFFARQFENFECVKAHYETTAREIWHDTDGNVDIFVSAVGTGGTISGVGKFLREKHPGIKIVAVEPADSPMLSRGVSGPHKLQGIGAGFVPKVLDTRIYDDVIAVEAEDAINCVRLVAACEGLLCGYSSGAALFAAAKLAARDENAGKTIVVILPDGGDRYLSCDLFGK